MKTTLHSIKIVLTLAACLSGIVAVRGTENIKAATGNSVAEDFGYDFFGGKSNKIDRIITSTPTYVYVMYEGGKAARKIPRTDLPDQLKLMFPFDFEKSAQFLTQQTETAAQQQAHQAAIAIQRAAAHQAAVQDAARRRVQTVEAQIKKLAEQDIQLQKQIYLYRSLPHGNGRKVKLMHLQDEQQGIREQIEKLRQQLR